MEGAQPQAQAPAPGPAAVSMPGASQPGAKKAADSGAKKAADSGAKADSSEILPTSPFVQKLYALLVEESEREGPKRAEWVDPEECTRRGWPQDAFTVLDNAGFQREVLPKFYRHANFTRRAPVTPPPPHTHPSPPTAATARP